LYDEDGYIDDTFAQNNKRIESSCHPWIMVGEELLPAWLLATFSLVHQLALLIQPRPLWLAIGYITHALRVKEVASSNQSPTTLAHQYTNHGNNTRQGLDLLWRKQRPLLWPAKLDQRRKHQRHLAALVHDRAPTVPARHLARQLVRVVFGAGAVKYKILGAVFKRHVGLFKDGGPLEGGAFLDKRYMECLVRLGYGVWGVSTDREGLDSRGSGSIS
jgi:hypothetical protein